MVVFINTVCFFDEPKVHLLSSAYADEEVNLVTAFVPSETACFASSPGRRRRTAVWISLDERVDFLLYLDSLEASVASLSKMSLMKEFKMDMPLFEMPVLG